MSEKFHNELKELKKDLLVMANLSKDMLHKSVLALREQDMKLVDSIISKKFELARLDSKIEENAFRMLALYQPMAKDLRTLACALKLITYLARIEKGKCSSTV